MARIAIIGPAYPYRGGPPLVVANTFELLSTRHTVEVFSFTRLYPKLLFPGVRQEDVSKHPAKQHPVRRLIDSINPLTWLKTRNEILKFKPDLVLVDWYQPFFGACYRVILSGLRRHGIRIVFLTENIISHESRFIDSILTRAALSQADGFIAFSESVSQSLEKWYPSKPVSHSTLPLFFTKETAPVQWNGSEAKIRLELQDKRVLLFFGYIRRYKGLRNLIAAFPDVYQRHSDAFLLIVGECYEDAAEYNKLIAESAAKSRIRWINSYIANEDVALYYAASDIVVLPYLSATQSGIVKIAFGFEKPVLATDVGGLAEEIGQWSAGKIVKANDVEQLAYGLNSMLAEKDLSTYAEGARRAKNANSFDAILTLTERFLARGDFHE